MSKQPHHRVVAVARTRSTQLNIPGRSSISAIFFLRNHIPDRTEATQLYPYPSVGQNKPVSTARSFFLFPFHENRLPADLIVCNFSPFHLALLVSTPFQHRNWGSCYAPFIGLRSWSPEWLFYLPFLLFASFSGQNRPPSALRTVRTSSLECASTIPTTVSARQAHHS